MYPERLTARTLAIAIIGWITISSHSSGPLQASLEQAPAAGPRLSTSSSPASPASRGAVLSKYCQSCHNQRLRTAGLTLDTADVGDVGKDPELWEKVVRKLRVGAMPPPGLPRPDQPTIDAFVSSIESEIDRAAAIAPHPGRTETFHRLNRAEYQNAIRDLLALETDIASLLPADDAGQQGFDNIGNVLSVSPALLERYMLAARKLSRLAVGLPPRGPAVDTYRVSSLLMQDDRVDDNLPFGSRGGAAIHQYFPVDGEYSVKVTLQRTKNSENIIGLGRPHQLDVRVDGTRVARFNIGGEDKGKPAPRSFAGRFAGDPEWERYIHHADEGLEVRFFAKAGPGIVGVSFVDAVPEPVGVLQPRPEYTISPEQDELQNGTPGVEAIAIGGPYTITGSGDTPSRRKTIVCRPARAAEEEPCARKILSALARRAYRGPVASDDIQTLLSFYKTGREAGSFDAGIQFALERILADPRFLFRVESDPPGAAPGTAYRINDLELASRLSFFLWSSIPDDELLELAVGHKLSDPLVLEQQVQADVGGCPLPGARRQLRRPVAATAQPSKHHAGSHAVSRFRREPSRRLPEGNGALPPQSVDRRSQRRGPVECELHVRSTSGWLGTIRFRTSMEVASGA